MSTLSTSRVLSAAALALLAGSVASAQSLGELAEKEKARREQERSKRGASKVITEDDLRRGNRGTLSNFGGPGEPAAEASPAAEGSAPASTGGVVAGAEGAAAEGAPGATPASPAAAASPAPKTEDEIRAEQQNEWRQRLQQAQAEVAQLTDRVNRLQTSLNDLSSPLYGATRTTLMNQWETAQKDLAAARQKASDIEEEGRRKSYR